MSSAFTPVLDGLTRQRGVRAALVASEQDGIVVDSSLQIGQSGDRVAALAASLYRKARLSARASFYPPLVFPEPRTACSDGHLIRSAGST